MAIYFSTCAKKTHRKMLNNNIKIVVVLTFEITRPVGDDLATGKNEEFVKEVQAVVSGD